MIYEWEPAAYADVEQTPVSNRLFIATIFVEEQYRGCGVGTALMKVICRDADLRGQEIWLVAQSADGRMADLVSFYSRLGFDGLGMYMVRKPQPILKEYLQG